jgi:hypothetical protein
MKTYSATVYLTVAYNLEIDADTLEEAEVVAIDTAECRIGTDASYVGIDKVHVIEREELNA